MRDSEFQGTGDSLTPREGFVSKKRGEVIDARNGEGEETHKVIQEGLLSEEV